MSNTVEPSEAAVLVGGTPEPRAIGRRREDRIVGVSPTTQRAVEQAAAAAQTELPVLVAGPHGCGKELFARAVHAWGRRASGPFQAIACDAVPEGVHAREVFGCAAGVHALLPADYDGILARGVGGTSVLSGIDSLRSDVRAALVAALGEKTFQREGESTRVPLRTRLVVTTTDPGGTALGDLPHHRIELTALGERPEDVLPLAAHFLQAFAAEEGVRPGGFTPEARSALLQETWAGNVGELRERIRMAVKLAGGEPISPESLMLANDGADVPSFKEAKRAFETRYVEGLLRRCGGNISRAARLAKKDRKDFYDVIRRTGVDPSRFRH